MKTQIINLAKDTILTFVFYFKDDNFKYTCYRIGKIRKREQEIKLSSSINVVDLYPNFLDDTSYELVNKLFFEDLIMDSENVDCQRIVEMIKKSFPNTQGIKVGIRVILFEKDF